MDMRGANHVQGKDVLFQVRVIASLCGSHVYRDTTRLIVDIVSGGPCSMIDVQASSLDVAP